MAVSEGTSSAAAPQIAVTHLMTSAAQAGRPDRVVGVDAGFAEQYHSGEIGFTDCLVGKGLIALQQGDAAAAVPILESVVEGLGEAASGYSLSALALARAATGDIDGAYTTAEAATNVSSSTYSDHVTALTARALAAARSGDAQAADAALAEVRKTLQPTDDRHGRNLLSLAAATVDQALGRPVSPGSGAEAAAASPGWAAAYRLAAGLN
jgi:hypothetical protein